MKGLLQRVDTTTMLASVEARVPFLDHELIEYSYRNIPYDLKLHWKSLSKSGNRIDDASIYSEVKDTPKYLLKKVAEKYLPESVIYRKKMGFPVPLNDWLNKIEEDAKSLLSDAYWLNRNNLDELIKDCASQSRSAQIIWMFINIEIFRQMYFEKEWRY